MSSNERKQQNLPSAVVESMASEKLTDVAAGAADIALDALIESGALDGIPVFGALTGLWRAGVAVRDHLFAVKIATFLSTFQQTPIEARQAFITKLQNEGRNAEFGEQIILLIDRMDDMEKPNIVGRLLSAAALDLIPLAEALRLSKIVDRVYSEDIPMLVDLKPGVQADGDVAASLFSAGLLEDYGNDGGTLANPSGGGALYRLNRYGELLIKYGLKQ